MKKYSILLLFIIFACILIILFRVNNYHKEDIQDCTKDSVFYLEKHVLHPNSCKVVIKGYINGSAVVNGDTIFKGQVNKILYEGDWYDNPFRVEYKNLNITEGDLVIVYKFFD